MGELTVVRRITVLCVSFMLVLSACESDDKKLARLEQEQTSECLLEQAYHDKAMTARGDMRKPMTQEAGSVARIWMEHHTKCELAQRDLNKFMNGR